jgi:hypothetical protein
MLVAAETACQETGEIQVVQENCLQAWRVDHVEIPALNLYLFYKEDYLLVVAILGL